MGKVGRITCVKLFICPFVFISYEITFFIIKRKMKIAMGVGSLIMTSNAK